MAFQDIDANLHFNVSMSTCTSHKTLHACTKRMPTAHVRAHFMIPVGT